MTTTTTPRKVDFYVLGWGLVYASVCTSLKPADATARLNREVPTGISSQWAISADETFSTGEANPHQCETFTSHQHYLFNC